MQRKFLLRLVLLLAVVASLLPWSAAWAANWTLMGQITDSQKRPVAQGIQVLFRYDSGQPAAVGQVDAYGNYRIYPEAGKPGTLVIMGHSWLTREDHFVARAASKEETWNYTLQHDYWTLRGVVTDYKTGKPVPNLQVNFKLDKDGRIVGSAMTDVYGNYVMRLPVSESGTFFIIGNQGQGWKDLTDHFAARGSERDETWNYVIHTAVERFLLTGQVTDKEKRPVPHMTVAVRYDDKADGVATHTDGNGYYRLEPEIGHPFAFRVSAQAEWLPVKDHFVARNDSKKQENWNYTVYHNYWTLKGQVVDEQKRPVPGVYVEFRYDAGWSAPADFNAQTERKAFGYTDGNGYFTIHPLVTRSGTLVITGPGWKTKEDHFAARGSECEQTWNYTLQRQ